MGRAGTLIATTADHFERVTRADCVISKLYISPAKQNMMCVYTVQYNDEKTGKCNHYSWLSLYLDWIPHAKMHGPLETDHYIWYH